MLRVAMIDPLRIDPTQAGIDTGQGLNREIEETTDGAEGISSTGSSPVHVVFVSC